MHSEISRACLVAEAAEHKGNLIWDEMECSRQGHFEIEIGMSVIAKVRIYV